MLDYSIETFSIKGSDRVIKFLYVNPEKRFDMIQLSVRLNEETKIIKKVLEKLDSVDLLTKEKGDNGIVYYTLNRDSKLFPILENIILADNQ